MKKIIFGITSLTLGGAERVLVDIANKLSSEYDITIYTIYDGGELKKQLNDKVKTISMYSKPYNEYNKLERIKISIRLLLKDKPPKGYDTQIAFLEGPITRLFSKKSEAKKIVWVHNDISKVFGKGLKSKAKQIIDGKVYKKYNNIIFVSEENKKDFNNIYGNKYNERVIRNYLDYEKVIEKAEEPTQMPYYKNDINLVSVCRLVEQKALDRFIKVYAKLEKEGIHSKVYIIGDGNLRYTLQKQIDSLGETNNFILLGAKENPYPYIKNADYFCLLSYYEGYGMVLDEAKILNKDIIITDTAAKESIRNYKKSNILENTEKGIYIGLKKILTSDNIKEQIILKNNEQNAEYYKNIIEQIKEII